MDDGEIIPAEYDRSSYPAPNVEMDGFQKQRLQHRAMQELRLRPLSLPPDDVVEKRVITPVRLYMLTQILRSCRTIEGVITH